MTDQPSADLQPVLETLADPDCREILTVLAAPRSAGDVADRCDLPRTSAYRKLEALADAGLARTGTGIRTDGHHEKTYERTATGVLVLLDEETGDGFEFELAHESTSADERLARFWSRISEEL
ncbi:helix-turn-helix domain-containing protein [Halobaculum lipolyticum]|uniref:Helix-turn-helix domain-containing protein n=1 Tax=Halobaculum lipolyticum TaxID=3032001 RepID=A0ABD5W8J6_9EURY|nr:helix-turn-helix domain-containing protein [Halobaculum sp. DT31]